jgi:hypothetical protein
VLFARMKMLQSLATDVGADTSIASNMEYHANVAVLRFASCASAEIVAFGVVTIRVASARKYRRKNKMLPSTRELINVCP